MIRKVLILFLLLVAASLLAGGMAIGYRHWRPELTQDEQNGLRLFQEVRAIAKERCVDEVDGKKLLESAIKGMIATLDPHSAYLPPEPYKEMKVEMSGTFAGLGIEITIKDGKLLVVAPLDETPAFRAGIKADDHIMKIDETPTRGMGIENAVKLMRGPKGTGVTLTISRAGSLQPLVFSLVRDIIKTKSVKSRMLDTGYGYVRISGFKERTGDEFAAALRTLHEQSGGALKGLVLDLRHNPGGYIDEAIRVANHFIGKNFRDSLIVYTQGRSPSTKQEFNATIGAKEPEYPMAILINGSSASASEIVAGALQDHRRAVLVGTQSFGKGSVQTIMPLANGAGLKLTTARYYTPRGRSIQAKGITPDIQVDQIDPTDRHLSPADKRARMEGDKPEKPAPAAGTDEETSRDYQLVRALELVRDLNRMKGIYATDNADARASSRQ